MEQNDQSQPQSQLESQPQQEQRQQGQEQQEGSQVSKTVYPPSAPVHESFPLSPERLNPEAQPSMYEVLQGGGYGQIQNGSQPSPYNIMGAQQLIGSSAYMMSHFPQVGVVPPIGPGGQIVQLMPGPYPVPQNYPGENPGFEQHYSMTFGEQNVFIARGYSTVPNRIMTPNRSNGVQGSPPTFKKPGKPRVIVHPEGSIPNPGDSTVQSKENLDAAHTRSDGPPVMTDGENPAYSNQQANSPIAPNSSTRPPTETTKTFIRLPQYPISLKSKSQLSPASFVPKANLDVTDQKDLEATPVVDGSPTSAMRRDGRPETREDSETPRVSQKSISSSQMSRSPATSTVSTEQRTTPLSPTIFPHSEPTRERSENKMDSQSSQETENNEPAQPEPEEDLNKGESHNTEALKKNADASQEPSTNPQQPSPRTSGPDEQSTSVRSDLQIGVTVNIRRSLCEERTNLSRSRLNSLRTLMKNSPLFIGTSGSQDNIFDELEMSNDIERRMYLPDLMISLRGSAQFGSPLDPEKQKILGEILEDATNEHTITSLEAGFTETGILTIAKDKLTEAVREITAILNKLTPKTLELQAAILGDTIKKYNKVLLSDQESAFTFHRKIIEEIYEKACLEKNYRSMYAELIQNLINQYDPKAPLDFPFCLFATTNRLYAMDRLKLQESKRQLYTLNPHRTPSKDEIFSLAAGFVSTLLGDIVKEECFQQREAHVALKEDETLTEGDRAYRADLRRQHLFGNAEFVAAMYNHRVISEMFVQNVFRNHLTWNIRQNFFFLMKKEHESIYHRWFDKDKAVRNEGFSTFKNCIRDLIAKRPEVWKEIEPKIYFVDKSPDAYHWELEHIECVYHFWGHLKTALESGDTNKTQMVALLMEGCEYLEKLFKWSGSGLPSRISFFLQKTKTEMEEVVKNYKEKIAKEQAEAPVVAPEPAHVPMALNNVPPQNHDYPRQTQSYVSPTGTRQSFPPRTNGAPPQQLGPNNQRQPHLRTSQPTTGSQSRSESRSETSPGSSPIQSGPGMHQPHSHPQAQDRQSGPGTHPGLGQPRRSITNNANGPNKYPNDRTTGIGRPHREMAGDKTQHGTYQRNSGYNSPQDGPQRFPRPSTNPHGPQQGRNIRQGGPEGSRSGSTTPTYSASNPKPTQSPPNEPNTESATK